MRVDVSTIKDIKGATIEADLREAVGSVGAAGRELELSEPAEVHVRVTNTGHGTLLVQGEARARARATCDRCLAPFDLEIISDFERQYVKGHEGAQPSRSPGGEGRGDDVREYQGDFVDIGSDVRESLSLAVPMKLVCTDECKGLCPSCGKNLNGGPCDCPVTSYDARLTALSDLDLRRRADGDRTKIR
ncbi:MAG: YceD family protein [Betaproteobacteria bacterium]